MLSSRTKTLVAETDKFLAEPKALVGDPPSWEASTRDYEYQAVWLVSDDLGAVKASLRFRVPKINWEYPSLSLVFANQQVYRVDIQPASKCEPNPPWASKLSLPPRVCGSHVHRWEDNRQHILDTGLWSLPARRPVEVSLRRIEQMLPWLCDQTLISLRPDQRNFDIPSKNDLFGLG